MKNNKGFSIIELIVSFSICIIVVVVLFQIVVVLKEVYEKSSVKTVLLNKQNIIVNLIYEDILDKGLNSVASCGDYCITFKFTNNTSKNLSYSEPNKSISYGDYNNPVISGSTINKAVIFTNNEVISVYMPISHKLFSNSDFGIHIVHYVPTS